MDLCPLIASKQEERDALPVRVLDDPRMGPGPAPLAGAGRGGLHRRQSGSGEELEQLALFSLFIFQCYPEKINAVKFCSMNIILRL